MINQERDDAIALTLVGVSRVTKVVAGGRTFSFAACVVAGDHAGSVGYGHGKAKEVTEARAKANMAAKKAMIKVPLFHSLQSLISQECLILVLTIII